MTRPRRLLTIGHSYCVRLNRRLADALACAGEWEVTAAAPARFRGDFAWHTTQRSSVESCRVVAVPAHATRRVHLMLYGRALAELLRQPWDLVHCWEEPYVASAVQIAAGLRADVPLVFATFQNILKVYPPPFNWMERYTMRRADGIIAFGRTIADVVAQRGGHRVPIRVIPPGVDVTEFRPDETVRAATRSALGWRDATPVVGFVGRLAKEKGVRLLCQVLDHLRTPWRALFVGSGPLERDVRAWGAGYGGRVAVRTSVTHDDVAANMNAMDVLCVPSLTTARWREQFGRVLIEAFASGVPVLASDSGEIPFVVGDAGVLVPEGHLDAWTEALEGLLMDPGRRSTLSVAGRRRAESTYSWPIIARQHFEFFEEVLAGAQRRAAIVEPVAG